MCTLNTVYKLAVCITYTLNTAYKLAVCIFIMLHYRNNNDMLLYGACNNCNCRALLYIHI